jgi:uncharacterized membrane protein (UPF0127 family)
MDSDELRKKLYNEKDGPKSAMETSKERKSKILQSSVIVGLIIVVILGVWSLFTAPAKDALPPQACFKSDEVCFDLIFVKTEQEQEIGFSNYSKYPLGKVMLFPLDPPRVQAMWMSNMSFSIDIIWLDSRNRISHIIKNAEPCEGPRDCIIYEAPGIASSVIEVPAGFSIENNLFDGNEIKFKNMPK